MRPAVKIISVAAMLTLHAPLASAQVNFVKDGYCVAMGDSVAAGAGAMPDFDVHPTNLGHSLLTREFAVAWKALP